MTTIRHDENVKIIQQLKQGNINPQLLKNYSGWGGLKEALYQPKTYQILKNLYTDQELTFLKSTLKNAYYTPQELVKFIYAWLAQYGFTGGQILEPAIGNGIFIEHMPESFKANSQITGVEIDPIASQIIQKIYPEVTLHSNPFEHFQPAIDYDLIIGNPPYGAEHVNDKKHADLNQYCIHHYFIAKCMRLLKAGGLLAMIMPSYFMDNQKDHTRHIISQEGGSLLAAYRLPDNLFSQAKITVDIIFLIKDETTMKWQNTVNYKIGKDQKPINEYFYNHSAHILGNLEIVSMFERTGLTCKARGELSYLLEREIKLIELAQKATQTKPEMPPNRLYYIQRLINQIQDELEVVNMHH